MTELVPDLPEKRKPRCTVKPGFEFGEALLIVLNQGQDSRLSSGRDLLPEFVRDWRTCAHAAGLAIGLQLGNFDL